MIDKEKLRATVEKAVESLNTQRGSDDIFVVDVAVDPQDNIVVELDSATGLDIDACSAVTRAVEADFDRDVEDYELEVGSVGLTAPMKVRRQFENAVGSDVEVLTSDGRKLRGLLRSVEADGFVLDRQEKQRPEGAKRPVMVTVSETIPFAQAKRVVRELKF